MLKSFKYFVVISLLFSLLSCASSSDSDALAVGKYVLNESNENDAWIQIKEGNTYEFNRGIALSYRPSGDYTINKGQLILSVSKDEIYKFEIKKDALILLGNEDTNKILKKGSVFKFVQQSKNLSILNVDNIQAINLYKISGNNSEVRDLLISINDEKKLDELLAILSDFTLQNGIVSMMAPMYHLEIVYLNKEAITYDLWLKANEQASIGSLEDSHKIYGLNIEMSKQLILLLDLK